MEVAIVRSSSEWFKYFIIEHVKFHSQKPKPTPHLIIPMNVNRVIIHRNRELASVLVPLSADALACGLWLAQFSDVD